jgi:hypothetical protein
LEIVVAWEASVVIVEVLVLEEVVLYVVGKMAAKI